jgi:hypothetical protein
MFWVPLTDNIIRYFCTNFQRDALPSWEAWWLSGSAPDCCPAVPGLNPASPQPTADCQSSGGLSWHLAAGWPLWGATEEKIMRNEPLVRQKHIKKTKYLLNPMQLLQFYLFFIMDEFLSWYTAGWLYRIYIVVHGCISVASTPPGHLNYLLPAVPARPSAQVLFSKRPY